MRRRDATRIVDGGGVAYFIEGIGPPLQQIAADHRALPCGQASRDILALITHIDGLEGERQYLLKDDLSKQRHKA